MPGLTALNTPTWVRVGRNAVTPNRHVLRPLERSRGRDPTVLRGGPRESSRPAAARGARDPGGWYADGVSGHLSALFWLGLSLLLTLLRHLVPQRRTGFERFTDNYRADRLSPMSGDERALLARSTGCIACGRCDRGEGSRIAASRGEYPGVMQLVLSATRGTPDFAHSSRGFRHVPRPALEHHAQQCPAGVPIAELADFVTAHAETQAPHA